jgi:hypothetical protein
MIEILTICIHIIVITILCYMPSSLTLFFTQNKKIDIIEHLEIGIILNIFLLLLLSFLLRKDSFFIFYILFFIFSLNLFFCIKDLYKKINYKNFSVKPEFLFLFFLVFVLSIDLANNLKLGWDAQNYWYAKKMLFENNGDIFDLKFTPRDDYPHLGSFLWFIYSEVSILKYEYFGRIFYIYLFLISILSTTKIANVGFFRYVILSLIILFLLYDPSIFNGYQEIIIFSLLVILINSFYKSYFKNTGLSKINKINKNYFLIFLIMGILIWIKNETSIIIMIFLLSFLMIKRIDKYIKILFFSVFGFFLICKSYIFNYVGLANKMQKGNYEFFKVENFFEFINIDRIFSISKFIIFGFFDVLIYPISFLLIFVMLKFEKKKNFNTFLVFNLLFSFGFLYAAFLFTSFPLEWHLKTSLNRIMFQTSGLSLIALPIFYNFLSNKKIL